MSFWAWSRLFQNVSPAIRESNSVRRLCALATSKKPPQVRGFARGGFDLLTNRFKHGRATYRSDWGESSSSEAADFRP
jgi:hypothetical protein